MSLKKKHTNKNTFYFTTFTCYRWLHLIELTNLYDHVYQWFDHLKTLKVLVSGYVIMPNHMHLIVYVSDTDKNINTILGNGKRFMAYEIIKRLEQSEKRDILNILKSGVKPNEIEKGKLHNVFEPSFDLKDIQSEKFIVQKLNYVHQNPARGKWHLVVDYRDYIHSSAGFYELGKKDAYEVIHYEMAPGYFLQSPH